MFKDLSSKTLVSIESEEAAVGGQVALVRLDLEQVVPAGFKTLLEQVGQGEQAHVAAGVHRVDGRLGATAATANQADLDHVAPSRMGMARDRHRSEGRGRGQERGGLQELMPGHVASSCGSLAGCIFMLLVG